MDPPKFGRGREGEIWQYTNAIIELFSLCSEIMCQNPILFIITAYNIIDSPFEIALQVEKCISGLEGKLEYGNLIQEEKSAGRKIHQAVYARWSSIIPRREK